MEYILMLVAFGCLYYGYAKIKEKSEPLHQNRNRIKTKIMGVCLLLTGAFFGMASTGMLINSHEDSEKLKVIASELQRLGVANIDTQTVRSGLVFMPKGATVEDYLLVDAKAKEDGFKNGFDYLLTKYRAEQQGLSLSQYQEKERQAANEKVAAEKKKTSFDAQTNPQNSSPSSAITMPKSEFWTDRGQYPVEVYKHACKNAYLNRQSIVNSLSVAFSASPEGKLASNLGTSAISNTRIWWSEESSKCYGSFTISGMVNGSSYNINRSGTVYGFDPDSSGGYWASISLY